LLLSTVLIFTMSPVVKYRHEVIELSLLTADEITALCQRNYGSPLTKLRFSAN